MKNIENFYLRTIKILLFIVPFLPLYISRSMLFPFITGRHFAFRIITEIALVLWTGLLFLNRSYRPKMTPLLWALVIFFAIVGLADLLGVNPYNSFWSRYERMEGYFLLIHLAAYVLILVTTFKKKDWNILLHLFMLGGLFVSSYAVYQKLFLGGSVQGADRVDGTIGNPTYLAAYLLFMLIVGFLALLRTHKPLLRYGYGLLLAFYLFTIYLTASRGPILALLFCAALFPVLYLFFGKHVNDHGLKYRKQALVFLVVVFAIPIGFYLVRGFAFVKTSPILSRFANISLTEKTTRSRFLIWNISWQGFKERPILGWGQENYIDVFSKYYDPKLYDQEPWFDRSHNIVFDWLINAGALGLLSYLALFGAVFLALWRAFESGDVPFREACVLFLGFIAYFIQNLLVFDNFSTYVIFFALLAYVNSFSNSPSETSLEKRGNDFSRASLRSSSIALACAAALVLPAGYYANIRPIQESRSLIGVLQILARESINPDAVLAQFKHTFSYRTFGDNEGREQFSRLASQIVDQNAIPVEKRLAFIEEAIHELEMEVLEYDGDIKAHLGLGALYNQIGSVNPEYILKGRAHVEKALALSPGRQTTYFLEADSYLSQNDGVKAVEVLRKAADLAPAYIVAQSNLAFIAANYGMDDVADQALADILLHTPADFRSGSYGQAVARVADFYVGTQKFDRALKWYEIVVRLRVDSAQYRANLAGLYFKKGMKVEAAEQAKIAAQLDPKNFGKDLDVFLKQLEK